MNSHAAVAAKLSGNNKLVQEVLHDLESSSLSEKEKGLLRYIEKLNAQASSIQQSDIDKLKSLGWTDGAIYDALSVCALFRFYNTWNDGAGTENMSPQDYQFSGERLAQRGYRLTSFVANMIGEI